MKTDKETLKETVKKIAELYPKGRTNENWNDDLKIEDDDEEFIVSDCIKDISHYDLGFCGCGSPEKTLGVIRLILQVQEEKDYDKKMDMYNNICGLEDRNKNYGVLIDFVLYILDDKGFLEHGSSISSAWLTEKGKLFLNLLEM